MKSTIGEELQAARIKKKLTLEQAVEATNIRIRQLKNLEENRFNEFPSRTQARGFIRLYASFLGLDPHSLMERFDTLQEAESAQESVEIVEPVPAKKRLFKKLVKPVEEPAAPAKSDKEPQTVAVTENEPGIDPAIPIFTEIGRSLRSQREKLSLSLEDISTHTHIRMMYLQALEEGQFDRLPSPLQVRGLLNNYAEFLSLEVDPLLGRYADALQARRGETPESLDSKRVRPPVVKKSFFTDIRHFLSADLLIGVFLIFMLFGFIIWGASQLLNAKKQASTPAAPPISEVLLNTASAEPGASSTAINSGVSASPATTYEAPLQNSETASSSSPTVMIASSSTLHLNITVNQPAFLRILEDGRESFNGRVVAGNAYEYNANRTIELLTGNAAALDISFNQSQLGIMGNFGQELHLVFSTQGVNTPTPAFTSTATATLPPTITPTITPTVPTPTVTPLIPSP